MALELGVLVAAPAMLERALDLVRDVDEAQLFLMDEGVRVAAAPRLLAAIDDGLDASLCATDAEARAIAPVAGGPRFGSQWDHATMVRDAVRVVAMTGGRIDDSDGATPGPGRRVAVRLTRDARDPKVAQALRAAVGYAAADLSVVVVVEPPARALLASDEHAATVVRAIATLRALGHRFVEVATSSHRVSCDVEVSW
ncbi:MAG TPA: hypothetical protein VGL86_20960 [Polyangia bacterium]|jgi:hypothetical protein